MNKDINGNYKDYLFIYLKLLNLSVFYDLYPDLSGNWEKDRYKFIQDQHKFEKLKELKL